MLFWVGVLIGVLFVYFAYKLGFYESWAMVFNILIAIYVAVFLRPVIAHVIPAAAATGYGNGITMFATALTVFLVLHGISYTFLTAQFTVTFPKIVNFLGTGLLGFIAGFLIWSFACFLLCTTPISQNSFIKELGLHTQFQETSAPYMSWWCNLVNSVVSYEQSYKTTEQVVKELLEAQKEKSVTSSGQQSQTDVNDREPNSLTDSLFKPDPCQ
ncbi:MAG: CvpA family protein [Sedimentisphaerales bacterium]|nr:CvpA family protein [Sedimentisphaerales bacterium]